MTTVKADTGAATAREHVPMPPVASYEDWLVARLRLLEREKELTREYDRVSAQRRRLPMVRVEKEYVFETPAGPRTLAELFEGRRQLIVYHFMFAPEWEKGCSGCTGLVNAMGDLSMLAERDTSFTLVSRAPLAKLEAYRAKMGWKHPWASSFGSEFNYDFHATADEDVTPVYYNYRTKEELAAAGMGFFTKGEAHGMSVFFRAGGGVGEVFHTYSTYGRGCESLTDSYALLDITPYGRQEDFEDSPEGWPQRPTYG